MPLISQEICGRGGGINLPILEGGKPKLRRLVRRIYIGNIEGRGRVNG